MTEGPCAAGYSKAPRVCKNAGRIRWGVRTAGSLSMNYTKTFILLKSIKYIDVIEAVIKERK